MAMFVKVLVVLMTAECFARNLVIEATTTSNTRLKPLDYNKLCQDDLGADFVWDEHVQTCVQCTSCTPGAQDPHCITCQALGINATPSNGGTNPQPDAGTSTPPPPQLDAGTSTPPPTSSTQTTHSSTSGMSSTSHIDVTNDDNKGSEALSKALWVILPCIGVAAIFFLIHVCWKCKLYTYIRKKIAPPCTMQEPIQETGTPGERQLMVVVQPTDGLGNQAAVPV